MRVTQRPTHGALSVHLRDERTQMVLVLRGELDVLTVPDVAAALAEAFAATREHGRRIMLDLAGLEFIDSAGLGLIARARVLARQWHSDVMLRSPSRAIHRLLHIAGLTDAVEASVVPQAVSSSAKVAWPCQIAVHEVRGSWVIAVAGSLDEASVSRLRVELEWAEDAGRPVTLDLRGVTFIDSAGVRSIFDADAASRHTPRRLVIEPSPAIRRLLEITKAGRELHFAGDVGAARAADVPSITVGHAADDAATGRPTARIR